MTVCYSSTGGRNRQGGRFSQWNQGFSHAAVQHSAIGQSVNVIRIKGIELGPIRSIARFRHPPAGPGAKGDREGERKLGIVKTYYILSYGRESHPPPESDNRDNRRK